MLTRHERIQARIIALILVVLALVLLATSGHAQQNSITTTPDSAQFIAPQNALVPQGNLAVTNCEMGLPVIHYAPDVPMDSALAAEITVHEMVHVQQLTPDSTGTCEQKLAFIQSRPETLLVAEAQAYCAQIEYARGTSKDDLPMFQFVVRALTKYFSGYFEPGDVSHALLMFCSIRSVTMSVADGTYVAP